MRIAIIIYFGQEQNLYENGVIAENIISGKGFSMSFFSNTPNQETFAMAPVYPYIMAFFFLLFGINTQAILAIQIFQVIIGSYTIIPLYSLIKKLFSHKTAILTCLIFAIYPDFLYSVYTVNQLALTILIIILIVYYSIDFQQYPSYKKSMLIGILYGFALLVEPVIISIIILMILNIVFWRIYDYYKEQKSIKRISLFHMKKTFLQLFLLCAFCIIIITPWLIRCFIVSDGNFIFIKLNGFNLWRGNNPEYAKTGIPSWFYNEDGFFKKEYEIDLYCFNEAIKYILNNLPNVTLNFFIKIYEFWWFPRALPEQSPLLRKLIYSPLLFLFFTGLILERKRIIKLFPLIIPIIAFTLIYSISFVLPRYRVPIQPFIFTFSAYSIVKSIDTIKMKLEQMTRTEV